MILLKIDGKSGTPKYLQIINQIRRMIEKRVIQPGDRLPSTRKLAEKLGIHRSTVSLAYQELWALGLIDLSPGSCARIRRRIQTVKLDDKREKGIIDWSETSSKSSEIILENYQSFHFKKIKKDPAALISFRNLDIDPSLFPLESFRACLARVTKKYGAQLLSYGEHSGFQPLREYIADRMQSHSISVSSNEILITNGSQQGIDLVFRMISSPGKAVIIESPTYDLVHSLLRLNDLKPLEVPTNETGMDLSVLSQIIKKEKPALVYTIPTFQNPTGVTTDQAHRERLISVCEQNNIPILEDGFEEEMKYFGKAVLPIKSMDKNQIVIYCGTFSKVLFPGCRIGWIAAEAKCIERLTSIRCFSDVSSSMILQAAMHDFCSSGLYNRQISRMHRIFRKRMLTTLEALKEYISTDWAEWSNPNGGYLIWLKIHSPALPPATWSEHFQSFGVEIAPGRQFFAKEPSQNYIRISISSLNEEEIVEGIKRIGTALEQIHNRAADINKDSKLAT